LTAGDRRSTSHRRPTGAADKRRPEARAIGDERRSAVDQPPAATEAATPLARGARWGGVVVEEKIKIFLEVEAVLQGG
jgi:hypothetical protein